MRWASAVVLGVAWWAARPAVAHALDCKDKQAVEAVMGRGRRAFSTDHYQQAIGAFSLAYECNGDTSLLFNLAKSHAELKQFLRARERLRQFRDKSPSLGGDAKKATDVLADEIDSHLGTLEVRGGPAAARVFVDATERGRMPVGAIELEAGEHEVRVVADGFASHVETIELRGRGRASVEVELKVLVAKNASSWSPSPIFWSGIALTSAGAVLAVLGGAVSSTQTSELADRCDPSGACPRALQDDLDEANAWANAANAGFAILGAGAVVAIVGAVVGPFPSKATVAIEPTGVGLRLRFE